MERKYNDKFIIIILAILMSLSFGIFSFQQIPQDFFSVHAVIITCLTAFFCAFYFFMKTKDDIFKKIKNNPGLFVISYVLAYIILKSNYDTRGAVLRGLDDFITPPKRSV